APNPTNHTGSLDNSHSNHALSLQHLGLFQGTDFTLATGNCKNCIVPPQALWYFQNEVIAIPIDDQSIPPSTPRPFLTWLSSPDVLQHAQLDESSTQITLRNGQEIPLKLTPKIASNRSYYDDSTTKYFQNQPLRLRGEFEHSEQTSTFIAKMIWPEKFRLDLNPPPTMASESPVSLTTLIEDQDGGASAPFQTKIMWERNPETPREWADHTVLGLMLNGAQGDDDEAHGGHFGLVTGRVGPEGQMADWVMNNFYDLDIESEKGIIPSMLPLDHYLMDLNSGQSYYRPSYLLVAILQQDRIAKQVQAAAQKTFEEFYRHDFLYHHAKANCTGLSIDILRSQGWAIPMKGATSYLKAIGAFYYVAAKEQSLTSGEKIYDYLTQEQTRLFPRMAFETTGQDLLQIVKGTSADTNRTLTPLERQLQAHVEAVVFIRIPQIPSSRALGADPVLTFNDYQRRVPEDRNDWQIVPVAARPFPEKFRDAAAPRAQPAFLSTTMMLIVFPVGLLGIIVLLMFVRRRR
ncbi:MAG: hypothetical protein K0U41_08010, partial [Gammaproteobacteria bacterium]|nr:hypothetical protein [Gammaproteobacteria bacterium]